MLLRVGAVLLIVHLFGYVYVIGNTNDHSQSELCRIPVMYHRLGVESVIKESNLSPVNTTTQHQLVTTSQPQLVTTLQPKTEITPPADYGKIVLSYPLFKSPISLPFSTPLVLPLGIPKRTFPPPRKPIVNSGIVFYVYSANQCKGKVVYMNQVGVNAKLIKDLDASVNITLLTNCDVPASVGYYLDIIIPIHMTDVMNITQKQWQTRMLYNAYLPYNYSFIIDSHVFPCDAKAPSEILKQFESSKVDISFSNLENLPNRVSGGAVLSRWSEGSFKFWQSTYNGMVKRKALDDQWPMKAIIESDWRKKYKFRWLSSNWFFASHGINREGKFKGEGDCFRSSIVVTGPLRWIHGTPEQCKIMNGQNNEFVNKPRCYFMSRFCNTTGKGTYAVFSEVELKRETSPFPSPELYWNVSSKKHPTSLFW